MSTHEALEYDRMRVLKSLKKSGRSRTMDIMHSAGFVLRYERLRKILGLLYYEGKVLRHGVGKGAGYEWELAPEGHVPPKKEERLTLELNEREFAAVLCGLRLVQEREGSLTNDHLAILSNGGELVRMRPDEIDELCERINTDEDD